MRNADESGSIFTHLITHIDRAAISSTYTTDKLIVTKLVRRTVQGPLAFAIDSFIANIELSRDDIPQSLIKP